MTILENLYRTSLEKPCHWGLFWGLPAGCTAMADTRIDMLQSYIFGLCEASSDTQDEDYDEFSGWLIELGEYPAMGWVNKLLDDTDGDHIAAIERFWSLLHQYVTSKNPNWFYEFNAEPRPSRVLCGNGTAITLDIRKPEHIRLVDA